LKNDPLAVGYGIVKVSFDIKGSYESIKEFLSGIETNLRIMDITQLTIGGESGSSNTMNVKVTLDAYYQNRTAQSQSGNANDVTTLQKK